MTTMMENTLLPAWEDSVQAAQATFRALLQAMAEPGTVQHLETANTEALQVPAPLMPATAKLCLALADFDTPLWLDAQANQSAVTAYLRFHCGVPLTSERSRAHFGVFADPAQLQLTGFAQGTMEYPDRSTTLLVQVPRIAAEQSETSWRLSGPGIAGSRALIVEGLPANFIRAWRDNTAAFPLGLDIVFCCGDHIVGLPRTTQLVEPASCM